ncbi:MAG: ABC transporter ATP-binding protein [Deltaproteobacteria bacterium]|nr:ABC transporter ATP-binding protein [Deltaproteobacteria bacterium]
MKDKSAILEARNLRVVRGGSVILDVEVISVHEGEILSVIGPNGAGKTTLLQALSALIKTTGGEVLFKGRRIGADYTPLEYRRRLSMVFQEPLLLNTTVFENVASGLKIRGVRGSEIRWTVEEQLERFGIGHLSDRSARTLSGGEAQRTSLARAFATNPEVLFLDEPFVSLDPPTRESIATDLQKVLRMTGTTTLMATHDRMEALRLSDRIAVMNGGKIHQIDGATEVMNRPANEFVAAFVGTETFLRGRVRDVNRTVLVVDVKGIDIEVVGSSSTGEEVILCIRPENVTLSPPSGSGVTSARNVFTGMIVRITPLGLFLKVEISCGFLLVAYVTVLALEELGLREGMVVTASIKATAIHMIKGRTG